jgi:hypothetical protein
MAVQFLLGLGTLMGVSMVFSAVAPLMISRAARRLVTAVT